MAGTRVVIAHDFMEAYGGAERISAEIALAFPKAPVFALLGRRSVARRMGVSERFTSLLPARDRLLDNYRLLAPLFPLLADHLRLPEADVVLSSSYGFAHRLRARGGAPRVCYTYSPLRFAWSMSDEYRAQWARGPLSAAAFRLLAGLMRASDRRSAEGVDRYLTQAEFVADQVRESYGREAEIIGAPVDCELFYPTDQAPDDYFLFCGRLVEPYKKVTALVEAFNGLDERLIVAGDGPERARLESIAGPRVEFVGELGDAELVALMQSCRAAVFPSRDDFGLIPVEVMACGRPVLAHAGGGALTTVDPGVTGELFEGQSAEAIADAVTRFEPASYDSRRIRERALNWDRRRFRDRLREIVDEVAGNP
jgi:glycosyltransferase involved in cell wall biosynthesis